MDPVSESFSDPTGLRHTGSVPEGRSAPILHGGGALLPLREYEMGHDEPDAPQAIITWLEEKAVSSLIA